MQLEIGAPCLRFLGNVQLLTRHWMSVCLALQMQMYKLKPQFLNTSVLVIQCPSIGERFATQTMQEVSPLPCSHVRNQAK